METPNIIVAFGDGIGPEIMDATLSIMQEAGAELSIETIEIGERIYGQDGDLGILPSSLKILKRTGALLYAPITIPSDDGLEPICDTLCKTLELETSERFDASTLDEDRASHIFTETFGYKTSGNNHAIFTTNEQASPTLAGEDAANPSALLQAAMMMLSHVGQEKIASRIYNAWKKTIEAGYHTPDMIGDEDKQLGTKEFAEMIISRLFR